MSTFLIIGLSSFVAESEAAEAAQWSESDPNEGWVKIFRENGVDTYVAKTCIDGDLIYKESGFSGNKWVERDSPECTQK